MWEKVKLLFSGIQPDLMKILKALVKIGVDVLLPLAINAVNYAERQGGTGPEKFDAACNYVKANAAQVTIGAIMTAVQNAWAQREAEGWK